MANPRYGEGDDVRRAVVAQLGAITPKWSRQLAREVSEATGEPFGERRMQRWLPRLISEGIARKTPEGYLLANRKD